MTRQTRLPRTHDNVYATVLGFLDIETVEYKPALDLFEPCDPPDRTHSAQAR
jgi:glucan phosphoethanolaminetransferase (alkaline phosphatase superfamily)